MYLHSLLRLVLYLFEMMILNGCGARVRPYLPVRRGFLESSGKANVKLCIRLTNIRNNSIFASCSPIHTRFPKNEIRRKSWDYHATALPISRRAILSEISQLSVLNGDIESFKTKWLHIPQGFPKYMLIRIFMYEVHILIPAHENLSSF